MKPVTVTLKDNCSLTAKRKTVKVKILQGVDGILIQPKGYSDAHSMDGCGYPVLIEVWKGELRVVIWGDVMKEDPTHIISLEGAREDRPERIKELEKIR